jgi:hypothetical protein
MAGQHHYQGTWKSLDLSGRGLDREFPNLI